MNDQNQLELQTDMSIKLKPDHQVCTKGYLNDDCDWSCDRNGTSEQQTDSDDEERVNRFLRDNENADFMETFEHELDDLEDRIADVEEKVEQFQCQMSSIENRMCSLETVQTTLLQDKTNMTGLTYSTFAFLASLYVQGSVSVDLSPLAETALNLSIIAFGIKTAVQLYKNFL